MEKTLRIIIFLLFFSGFAKQSYGQGATIDLATDSIYSWPYKLPIWGEKLAERKISFPLPVGVSVNYIYSEMDLDITKFGMSIGNNMVDVSDYLNEETLGFQSTTAGISGVNTRVDAWVFPFMNVYGMFSWVDGFTDVSLKPQLIDNDNSPVELPLIESRADFTAYIYGFGATFSYGVNNWFYTIDMNRSWTSSEILNNDVGVGILSFRAGYQFKFENKMKLATYAGFMYRNFINQKPVEGRIILEEVFPGLENQYDTWYDSLPPAQKRLVDAVRDPVLEAIGNENIFETPVDYTIKKDLIQQYTFQLGASLDINKNWSYRVEFGISQHQVLLITGANYRFGI